MSAAQAAAAPASADAIPWRVVPPLLSTALTMLGAGVLGSLLPLRFSSMGLSPGMIGLIATAEALGFLAGCLYAHRIIAPVGLERAYAAFAGMKAVAILSLAFATSAPALTTLKSFAPAGARPSSARESPLRSWRTCAESASASAIVASASRIPIIATGFSPPRLPGTASASASST
ncbi:MAG: hypothetical protein ABSG29_13830, partial [Steroidobacteraceae bacterium]